MCLCVTYIRLSIKHIITDDTTEENKRESIIMKQYISLTIVFYTKVNDTNSERPHVYVSHISVYLSNIYTVQIEAF